MCPECYEHWAIMGSSAQNTEERGTGDGNEGSGKVSTAPRPLVGPLHRLSWCRVLSNLKHWPGLYLPRSNNKPTSLNSSSNNSPTWEHRCVWRPYTSPNWVCLHHLNSILVLAFIHLTEIELFINDASCMNYSLPLQVVCSIIVPLRMLLACSLQTASHVCRCHLVIVRLSLYKSSSDVRVPRVQHGSPPRAVLPPLYGLGLGIFLALEQLHRGINNS